MIPAYLYRYIFLTIVTVMTMVIASDYSKVLGKKLYTEKKGQIAALFITFVMTLFIGLRPVSVQYFCDMANYDAHYQFIEGDTFMFNPMAENVLFDNLFLFVASERLGSTFFFLIIAIIYFFATYLGVRRLFPQNTLAAYVVFLGAFSTFSYGTNGIKAGAAAALFIWAMGYRDKLWICLPLIIVSWGFHHSMQLPVAAFVVTLLFKSPKWYYYGWTFCLLMALLHVGAFAALFASFSDDSGANYILGSGTDAYMTGFRLDFILYSAAPVAIGYYAEMKRNLQLSAVYKDLIHLYLCINGIWMLCMYASFTNRIAFLSWFLYPIILIYPFLNENWGLTKYRTFAKTMRYHLAFTLFMEIIYYGMLK